MCGNKTTFMVICVYKGGNINFPQRAFPHPLLNIRHVSMGVQ